MFFFCITLSPSSPGEPGGPEGPGSPCNNKTSRCFFNSGTHQQKTHTPFTHTTKQLTLCPFSPGSPARPSNPRSPCGAKKEKLHTFFVRKHTFKKKQHYEMWRSEVCYECGRRGTLGPDCPGMPLAPSDPGRPCKNNNSYVTRLLTDHCKHAMKARIRPAF